MHQRSWLCEREGGRLRIPNGTMHSPVGTVLASGNSADLQKRLCVLQEPGCDGMACLMEGHCSALLCADDLHSSP